MNKFFLALAAAAVSLFAQAGKDSPKPPAWTRGAKVAPVAIGNSPNSSAFGSRVYFAGQPSEADLDAYSKAGVKTVVNLRSALEMEKAGFDEAAAASKAGMKYVNVPIGSTPPSDAELAKIFGALDQAGSGKVLMHCATSNRVGMVWSIYRGAHQGLEEEDAVAEGKAGGLKNAALEKTARAKIASAKQK